MKTFISAFAIGATNFYTHALIMKASSLEELYKKLEPLAVKTLQGISMNRGVSYIGFECDENKTNDKKYIQEITSGQLSDQACKMIKEDLSCLI